MKMLKDQLALELKLFIRRKDELFWNLAFPVFFMLLYGFIYGDTVWDNMKAIEFMFPGIIVMALLVNGIMSTATGFVEDRVKGIYRRLSVTPLKKQTILGAQIIQRYLLSLIQALIITLIAVFGFKVEIVGNYFYFWLLVTFGSLCFLSIGFLLTTIIRSARSATPISIMVFFLFLFLGGIFFPLSIMPKFLTYIAQGLPSTHLNDALRYLLIEGKGFADIWLQLLILGIWLIASFIITIKFFKWE